MARRKSEDPFPDPESFLLFLQKEGVEEERAKKENDILDQISHVSGNFEISWEERRQRITDLEKELRQVSGLEARPEDEQFLEDPDLAN